MDIFKKLKNVDIFINFLSKILAWLMRFSFKTSRFIHVGQVYPDSYVKNNKPFAVCLWHDRLMLAPCVWHYEKPLHVLASNHSDGKLIAKVVENFSMPAVFGSTGKGIAALKHLIRLIKGGEYIAIIPDGPRGPRHKLAAGVIAVSKLAKTDILAWSFCVKRYFRFNSWDKFIFIWPFNRGVCVWEEPIKYEDIKDLTEDEAILLVENRINSASKKAHKILEGRGL